MRVSEPQPPYQPLGLKRTPWEHHLIVLIVLFACLSCMLPSGFDWSTDADSTVIGTGSLVYQLQWGSVFSLSALVLMRVPLRAWAHARQINPFLWVMVVYCILTIVWSAAPVVTLKKCIQLVGLIMLALAVQMNCKPWTHTVKTILAAIMGVELVSAVTALAFPSLGIDAYFGYAWRGIVSNKNFFGAVSALGVLLWVSVWNVWSVYIWVRWPGLLFSAVCVMLSTSSTSLAIAIVGPGAFFMLRRRHVGSKLWLLRIVVTLAIVVVLFAHGFFIFEGHFPSRVDLFSPFASLFGKSADLTGRTDIWDPLLLEIDRHWLQGVGYNAFWLGKGSASQSILDTLNWVPFQGHNGYLDMLNELGVIGIVLFVSVVLAHIYALNQLMAYDRDAAALFSAILLITLVSNLTESSLFRGINLEFYLFVLCSVTVTSSLYQRRYGSGVAQDSGTPAQTPASVPARLAHPAHSPQVPRQHP